MSGVDGDSLAATYGVPPQYPIESVDNALRLLLLLAERRQIRVSEVADELGIALSTSHRLLAMLTQYGFVAQDADSKAYALGPLLVRLGLQAAHGLELRTFVLPYIERLRDETRETCSAAVLQGNEMFFIACAESPNALRVVSRVGLSMPAHCTSVGKAWLACETDDFVRGIYPSPKLSGPTEHSLRSRADLLRILQGVRSSGFARNVSEGELGVGSVSATACDGAGRPVVSISISLPLARVSEPRWSELADAVMATRRVIEASIV